MQNIHEYTWVGCAGVEEELAELAVDLLLLSQELVNTKIKLQELSKVTCKLFFLSGTLEFGFFLYVN